MATQTGLSVQVAAAFESTFGTAPGSGYFEVPIIQNRLGKTRGLTEEDALLGRKEGKPGQGVIEAGGDIVVPLEAESIGHWLKAMFGAPTTTGTGPYEHVWESGDAATLPSQSIETWMSSVPHAEMVSGCVADQMQIEAAQDGGFMQATFTMVARDSAKDTSSGAGTPTAFGAYERFHATGAVLTRNGSAMTSKGMTMNLNVANNLDAPRGLDASGAIFEAVPVRSVVTGRVGLRFQDQAMLTQALDGDPCTLKLAFSTGSGKALSFELHEVYLPVPKVEVDGPGGISATFDFRAVADAATDKQMTVTLDNATASY